MPKECCFLNHQKHHVVGKEGHEAKANLSMNPSRVSPTLRFSEKKTSEHWTLHTVRVVILYLPCFDRIAMRWNQMKWNRYVRTVHLSQVRKTPQQNVMSQFTKKKTQKKNVEKTLIYNQKNFSTDPIQLPRWKDGNSRRGSVHSDRKIPQVSAAPRFIIPKKKNTSPDPVFH